MVIGVNTDACQPIEKTYRITRSLIELAAETDHPIGLITKRALIERDVDLLAPMAEKNLVSATLAITTLKHDVALKAAHGLNKGPERELDTTLFHPPNLHGQGTLF